MLVGIFVMSVAGCGQQDGTPLVFEMVQGGPLPHTRTIDSRPNREWKVSVSGAPWVQLPALDGTGPVNVAIGGEALNKTAGEYQAHLTVTNPGEQRSVPVILRVVARAPGPKFTYVSEPRGCTVPPGPVLPDQALCVVPDEKPPGHFKAPAV